MSTEQHNEGLTNTTTTNPTTMESTARVEEIIARLCHIIKRTDFDGYGFNLHSEKGKPGQYIGKVDSNSPAEYSGMREGDRILEVNGVNIGNETHKQVVQRIKAMADEVRLLLVDNGVEVTKHNEIVSKFVIRQSSSVPGNNNNNSQYETAVNNCDSNNLNKNTSTPSSPSISIKSDSNKSDIINNNNNNNNNHMTPSSNNTVKVEPVQSNGQQIHTTNMDGLDSKTTPIINPVTNPVPPNSITNPATAVQPSDLPNISSLNLKMSAAEMRSRLKKKYDPKRDTVDLKSKYDIIQKL